MKMWLFFQKPNMAEGEATPVVEAKRLVERDDEGMSQSYHEIFDTQVERRSTRTANWIQLHIISFLPVSNICFKIGLKKTGFEIREHYLSIKAC